VRGAIFDDSIVTSTVIDRAAIIDDAVFAGTVVRRQRGLGRQVDDGVLGDVDLVAETVEPRATQSLLVASQNGGRYLRSDIVEGTFTRWGPVSHEDYEGVYLSRGGGCCLLVGVGSVSFLVRS